MESIFWLVLMIALIVIEVYTMGLSTIWFALGALVAFIVSLFGAGTIIEIIVFLVFSIISLILTRPIAMKYLSKNRVKTNVDSLIGKKAIVIEKISNLEETGQAHINGLEWMARAKNDKDVIEKGSVVEVVRIDGVKLIVESKGEKI